MKIPKYIDEMLDKRAKSADNFMYADSVILAWCTKNNVEVSFRDIALGARSILEPYESADDVRKCILDKEGNNDKTNSK